MRFAQIIKTLGSGALPKQVGVRAMATNGSLPSPKKVLIVGGVAGGASCAARLRRLSEDAQITVFERGPYVSFANVSCATKAL